MINLQTKFEVSRPLYVNPQYRRVTDTRTDTRLRHIPG